MDHLEGAPALITAREAAARLGISLRALRRRISAGRLRAVGEGRCRRIVADDVAALLAERHVAPASAIPINGTTLGMLIGEARAMREQLDELRELMEIRRERIGLEVDELVALHRSAQTAIIDGAGRVDRMTWIRVLMRLERSHLEVIAAATGHANPWARFYRVACQLDGEAVGTGHWRLVHAARRNVEALAGAWLLERQGGWRRFEGLEG